MTFLLVAHHGNLLGQQLSWEKLPFPYGGRIQAYAIDSSGALVVGDYYGGIFTSGDGTNWRTLSSYGSSFQPYDPRAIVVDSRKNIFATRSREGNNRIGRFTDNNDVRESWQTATATDATFTAITVDTAGHVYAALHRPDNLSYAFYWDNNNGPYPPMDSTLLSENIVDLGVVYGRTVIAAMSHSIARSFDYGHTWDSAVAGLPSPIDIRFLRVGPDQSVFLATSAGIIQSSDGGGIWKSLKTPFPSSDIIDIAISRPRELFIVTGHGDFYRRSAEGTWSSIPTDWSSEPLEKVAATPNGNLFALTSDSIFVSSDHGNTWTACAFPSSHPTIESFAADASGTLYGFTEYAELYTLKEGGQSWTQVHRNAVYTPHSRYQSIWTPRTLMIANNSIFLTINGSIERSTDGGTNWSGFAPDGSLVCSLITAPDHVLYSGADSGRIFRSSDNGSTWTLVMRTDSHPIVRIFSSSHGTLFATDDHLEKCFRSQDNGLTWDSVDISTINSSPTRGLYFIQVSDTGIMGTAFRDSTFLSTDMGLHWHTANVDTAFTNHITCADYIRRPASQAFCGTTGGIYYSRDNGIHWNAVDKNFDARISALAIDSSSRIIAGTSTGTSIGYFRSSRTSGAPTLPSATGNTSLNQNIPNPSSDQTRIRFTLPKAGMVTLQVFDVQGRAIATLVAGRMESGTYESAFETANIPEGIYLYRLNTPDVAETNIMTVIR
ncbi:MAG: hypothetical protein JWQ98_82 [Chlorobi bacterium]|nr:hypothetical protein [Chlorobiota bacterium]